VRQLTNSAGEVTFAKAYDPYGNVTQVNGEGQSAYGYTGEQQDVSGLTYLRARYYNPVDGRFVNRDTFAGNYNSPQSLNRWNYTQSNPINYVDPTGHITEKEAVKANGIVQRLKSYNINIVKDWGYPFDVASWNYWFNDPVDSSKSGIRTVCNDWEEGFWKLNELQDIDAGVGIMIRGIRHFGKDFRSLIGSATIIRENSNVAPFTNGNVIHFTNTSSQAYRLYATIHEMGHVMPANSHPEFGNYFVKELGARCYDSVTGITLNYCYQDNNGTDKYDPGKYAGDQLQFMPSSYANKGKGEDFAETFREVVVSAYLASGDQFYIKEARLVYDFPGMGFNHDIGKRREVMETIINGSWRRIVMGDAIIGSLWR